MILILHNIIPNSHVSSLPMHVCYLIYNILERIEIDVAQVIANEIYMTAAKAVTLTKKIKMPITKQYIQQNCREDIVEQHGQSQPSQQQQQHQH
ncbi:hypothetical protein Lal_00033801 [Lupinus albus]|nr:hypothetical protein Lal_00033801 [Lupinus albus]